MGPWNTSRSVADLGIPRGGERTIPGGRPIRAQGGGVVPEFEDWPLTHSGLCRLVVAVAVVGGPRQRLRRVLRTWTPRFPCDQPGVRGPGHERSVSEIPWHGSAVAFESSQNTFVAGFSAIAKQPTKVRTGHTGIPQIGMRAKPLKSDDMMAMISPSFKGLTSTFSTAIPLRVKPFKYSWEGVRAKRPRVKVGTKQEVRAAKGGQSGGGLLPREGN